MSAVDFSWLANPPPHIIEDIEANISITSSSRRGSHSSLDILQAIADGSIENALTVEASGQPEKFRSNFLDDHDGEIDICLIEPAPRDWLVHGVLPSGKSAILAAVGGSSKTQLTFHLAAAVALGRPFMGRSVRAGRVMMLLGEEDSSEVSRRMSAIARYEGFTPAQIAQIKKNVKAYPLVGIDMRLTQKEGKAIRETGRAEAIIEKAKAQGGVRLIVIDHASLILGGDHNSAEDVSQLMRILNHIAVETGAVTLMLAHSPKTAYSSESSDATHVAGSSAYVNLTRGSWILSGMRSDDAKKYGINEEAASQYISMTGVKANYAPGGQVFWFKRHGFDETGLLEFVDLTPPTPKTKLDQKSALETEILKFIKKHPGQYSKTRFRDTQGVKDGSFGVCARDLMAAVEDMLARGLLKSREPTDVERARFNHSKQVKQVLDVQLQQSPE